MFLFNTEAKQNRIEEELKHLNKAIEMLQQNHEKKVVSDQYFMKKSEEFLAKKEKLEKKLRKSNYE